MSRESNPLTVIRNHQKAIEKHLLSLQSLLLPPHYYSKEEAAEYLEIKIRTVDSLVARGYIESHPTLKRDGKVLYAQSVLDNYRVVKSERKAIAIAKLKERNAKRKKKVSDEPIKPQILEEKQCFFVCAKPSKPPVAPTPPPGYLTKVKAAQYLGVDYVRLEVMLSQKKIAYGCNQFWCIKHGFECPGHRAATRFFHVSSLDAYKTEQETAHV